MRLSGKLLGAFWNIINILVTINKISIPVHRKEISADVADSLGRCVAEKACSESIFRDILFIDLSHETQIERNHSQYRRYWGDED
jgi:hypothetical protein